MTGRRNRGISFTILALGAALLGPAAPAHAICDVIPQPEALFRGETASLNRVYASPGEPLRISIDTAGCEAGSAGFQEGVPGTVLNDFNDFTLQGWTQSGGGGFISVQDFGLGPSIVGQFMCCAAGRGVSAPGGFLGDWNARGVTELRWIWASLEGAFVSGSEAVLRVSGPGGSAEYRPNLGFLQQQVAIWIVAPVDTSAAPPDWVVTGGTWQGLMAQVDEVVVVGTLDTFIDTYLLDEIQLQATPLIGSVTTLLFEPPAGTANAVVVPNGNDCASLAAEIAACDATLGAGTVVCRDDLTVSASADSLSFPMPDQGFAGPVTVAVSPGGAALPCSLATTTCGGPGAPTGLLACIDTYYAPDSTCEADPANRHPQFPGLTALPTRNDFSGICDSPDPSIPCSNSGADVQFTTDADGNLVVPIDWRGVLVPGTLPIPRLVSASASVAAFTGAPPEPAQTPGAPIEVPGVGFLQSFSPKGLRVDPLFNPLFNEDASTDTDLFGSADAEFGVIRVLRRSPAFRQCEAGDRAALPCIANFECPNSQCVPALCRGGSNDGDACTGDAQCPGGECGAPLFDFSDRYSNGGTGPILLTSAEYGAEALNPAAIDGLAATDDLFMFVRSEPLEAKDLNQDGDTTDSTIVSLLAARSGEDGGLGAVAGAVGRAGVRARTFPFTFPAVDVEDDVIALLEAEPEEAATDSNGDGDVFDTILRVFRLDTTPATELTTGLDLAVDADERIDRSSIKLSDGLVFFRRDETASASRVSTVHPWFGGVLKMSTDGRFVLFTSFDGTIVPGDTNNDVDLFVVDRDADDDEIFDEPGTVTVERLSVASDGSEGTCGGGQCFSGRFDITPDGRFVAQYSQLGLDPSDANDEGDVYVYDRDVDQDGIFDEPGQRETILISRDSLGNPGGGGGAGGGDVLISDDGRHVAFTSRAALLPADTNGMPDLYAYDRDADDDGIFDEAGATSLVLIAEVAEGFGFGMSADGRHLAFNVPQGVVLVPEDTNGDYDIYILDRDADEDGVFDEAGATAFVLASSTESGEPADGRSFAGVKMSENGRFVFFASDATNLVPGATNLDLLVRDRDADEDGIFDEPGAVEMSAAPAVFAGAISSTAASPSGRWLIGQAGGSYLAIDQETGLVESIYPTGINPGQPADIGTRNAQRVLTDEISGEIRTNGVDMADLSEDHNSDGDLLDVYLAVADARQAAPIPVVDLGAASTVAVAGGNAVYLRPEAAQGTGVDLNGDLDVDDEVVHLYRNRAPPAVNLERAASDVAVSDQVVAALVSEAGEGLLLNGDGDLDDRVVHVNDLATGSAGSWINLFLAADAVQAAGPYVAFTVPEWEQGASLNGDGDQNDRVLRVYDFQTASFVAFQDELGTPIPGLAVDDFVLEDGVVAFRVNEFDQGQNLNDVVPPIPAGVADGDLLDSVIHVADLATGTVYNGMQAAIPCPVEACDPRIPYRVQGKKVTHLTLEAEQGGNDLDQSGDGGTGLVLQHFNVSALEAGGSMQDACDVVGGALAGICTNTAEACAADPDCGGGTCYFPPGGCLFDTGNNCDPAMPNCAAGQFCAPILGMPGQGTCQEFQGPCLDDGQCAGGAFCTDDGADPERLFAAVDEEPDGRQRFVSLGRCTDGDGSCRNDGDCNEGAMCDGAVTVIATAADPDADGLADPIDNCPDVTNDDQLDTDQDGIGDACDRQSCGDGIQQYTETCDHGASNGIDGVCDASCQYEGAGVACADGIDNDGDGAVDLADQGCDDAADVSERSVLRVCDDGRDNDGDYGVDAGGDPGCGGNPNRTREDPACSDGLDNDGDGKIDWDGVGGFYEKDPNCPNASKTTEKKKKSCGLGFELALLLPLLRAARRRRRGCSRV